MARPAAMYSNNLSGDVAWLEMADAGFGSARISASCRRAATAAGGELSGELDAIDDAEPCRKRTQPLQIRLLFMAADDEPANVGHARESLDQHVDTFPRVEVAGIADRHRCYRRRHACATLPIRVPSGTTASRGPGAKSFAQRAGEAGGNRHIPVGPLPDERLTPRQPRELRRAWCGRGGHQRGQSRRDLGRIAVRLVDERWPGGQAQQERRDRQIARHHDVRAPCADGAPGGKRKIADPSREGGPADRRSFDVNPVRGVRP